MTRFLTACVPLLLLAAGSCGGSSAVCLHQGKSYAAGESVPSSDCNSCSCSSDGNVVCTTLGCPAPTTTWLVARPVQCGQNPWELMSSKGDGDAPSYANPELLSIDNYFEDHGVDLVELGVGYPETAEVLCKACSCPRGDYLVVRAKSTDVSTLTTKYGFTEIGASEAYGYAPKQCGQNPWKAPNPGKDGTQEEAQNVFVWAAGQSAPLSKAAFVYQTASGGGTCAACSCARGDRLVGFPQSAASATKLLTLEFSSLPH